MGVKCQTALNPAKRPAGDIFPWPTAIIMRGKARDSERAWRKFNGELGVERLCDRWFDLVLDSNVQARTGLILRHQQTAKLVREFIANVQQFRAFDTVCDALAQQHNLAQLRDRQRTFGRQRRQSRFDFGQMARR